MRPFIENVAKLSALCRSKMLICGVLSLCSPNLTTSAFCSLGEYSIPNAVGLSVITRFVRLNASTSRRRCSPVTVIWSFSSSVLPCCINSVAYSAIYSQSMPFSCKIAVIFWAVKLLPVAGEP